MTNQEIAAKFRDMAAQILSPPNSVSAVMFRQAAERLEANDALLASLKTIVKGFEDGVFVRDLNGDGKSDWAVKLLPFITALVKAQQAIAAAERNL